MIPVEQTRWRPGGGGNCVAACVASIFEVPLSDCSPEIPDGGSFTAVCEWTAKRHPGIRANCKIVGGHWFKRGTIERFVDSYPPVDVVEPPVSGYWIAGVVSPRGVLMRVDQEIKPSLHCVVMYGSELVWDPHPKREMGIGGVYDATWWTVRDPAKL